MERVIATYEHEGRRLDVVESVDDDDVVVRFVVDGEVLPADAHPARAPTAEEAMAVLASRPHRIDREAVGQVPYQGELQPGEVIALLEALDDEHKAQATYAQVIADFGAVRPFSNIVESETRHIEALETLMHRYDVPVPPNPWPGRVPRFASVADACAAGVDAEIENGALYDRLLATTERADILSVLRNLQEASQERHLVAFARGADRGGHGHGHGHGRSEGRGRGRGRGGEGRGGG